MSKFSAKDFSAMMKTPSRPIDASELDKKTIRDQKRGGGFKKSAMLPPPKAKSKVASTPVKRSTKMIINGTPYRDRAAERSLGINMDYNEKETTTDAVSQLDQNIERYLSLGIKSKSSEFSNPEEVDDIQQSKQRQERIHNEIAKSKYLGGDEEHTHHVKGLDFQLLSKQRALINHKHLVEPISESVQQKKTLEGVQTSLGRRIEELLNKTKHIPKRQTVIIFKKNEPPHVAVRSLGLTTTRGKMITPTQPADLIGLLADLRLPKKTEKSIEGQKKVTKPREDLADEINSGDIFDDVCSLEESSMASDSESALENHKNNKLAEDNLPKADTCDAEMAVAFDEADLNSVSDDDDEHSPDRIFELKSLSAITNKDSYTECFPDTFSGADQSGFAAGINEAEDDAEDPQADSRADRRRLDLIKKSSRASKLERESRAINKMLSKKGGEGQATDVKRVKPSE